MYYMYWGISVAVLLHMNFKGGGGHHQVRAALALAAEDSSDEESSISPMENGLLYRWAWGRIHATDVQSLAYDAFLEGLDQPKIMKLASLGAFGQNPQHIHKQIERIASKHINMPPVQSLSVPAINRTADLEELTVAECGCINMHDWVSHLSRYYPEDFQRIFNVDGSAAFWREQDPADPKLVDHPMLLVPDWQDIFVPYLLYADGARHSECGSAAPVRKCCLGCWVCQAIDSSDPGSIQSRSRIDPGPIQDRSRADPGLIQDRSRIDPGSTQGRSRVDPGLIQVRPRSFQGQRCRHTR